MTINENALTKLDKETKLHISSSASSISLDVTSSKDGWTVIYSDGSCDYKDEELTDIQNMKNAYDNATNRLGKLTDVTDILTKKRKITHKNTPV